MATNVYLKIDAVEGESTSAQGAKQIELLSWSHGVSMPVSSGSHSNVSVKHGRSDHQDLTVSKYLDKTSPILNLKTSGGDNIKTVVLTVFQNDVATGAPVEYYKIELEDVLITSLSVGHGGGDLPVETMTLHYNKIKWTYSVQGKDSPGGKKGNVTSGWDLEKNTKV